MRALPQSLEILRRSARVRKKRAFLTIAAIAWGAVALVLLVAFGEGLRKQMASGLDSLGEDIAVFWPAETGKTWKGLPAGRPVAVRAEDLPLLRARVTEAEALIGEITVWSGALTVNGRTQNTRVTGAEPAYGRVRNHRPQPGGRFLNEADEARRRRVIFLGDKLARDLFGAEDPVGRTLRLEGVPYTVVGVLVPKTQAGMYGGPDESHAVIPLSTFRIQYGRVFLSNLLLKPRDRARMGPAIRQVREALGARYRFDPEDERALHVWDTVETGDLSLKIMLGLEIFLGILGALTLTIGGVGVANIMYATVKERTREIGVQMALGAKAGWITGAIALEGLLYTLLGGAIGLALSLGIVALVRQIPVEGNEALQFLGRPSLSAPAFLLILGILGGIGVLAGYFPARRAAAIDPAETLRYE